MRLRAVVALVVGAAVGATVVGGCATDASNRFSAVVVGPAVESRDDTERDRWLVTVELDEGTIEGSALVRVGFYGDELDCAEGDDEIAPADLETGLGLVFTRVGRDADAGDPPVISGTDLDADC